MGSNSVLSGFLDETLGSVNIEVLKTCKYIKKPNSTIHIDTGRVTFLLYQNIFIIGHHIYIKDLEIDIINEKMRIRFNHDTETRLSFKDIKDKNDFFNIMLLQDTPFKFEHIEIIRDIISVLIDRFYADWWK